MEYESHLSEGWGEIVSRLGGAEALDKQARTTGAFKRARGVKNAVDLLQLTLAYCLSGMSFRTTSAWAGASGLAQLSDVALIKRIRNMNDWLLALINQTITINSRSISNDRTIRLIDATTVRLAGKAFNNSGRLWRIHSALDLPSEHFSYFEVTDQSVGERLDCAAVTPGEIRIGDRAYLCVKRMSGLLEEGADFIIRASWNQLSLQDKNGCHLNLIALLKKAEKTGRLDRKVKIYSRKNKPIDIRLVAFLKPPEAIEKERARVTENARKKGKKLQDETLYTAGWVILVTSLDRREFPAKKIRELYRLRWRIELAFKRLKSLIGLRQPPAHDERLAKPFILAHLLMILLIEPLIDEFEISPRQEKKKQPAA